MSRATMAVANIIPIIVLLVGIYATESQANNPCSWLTDHNDACINTYECPNGQFKIDIWEDCEVGTWLFTQDGSVKMEGAICFIGSYSFGLDPNDSKKVILAEPLDAEIGDNSDQNCFIDNSSSIYATLKTLDIDEDQPLASIDLIYTVDFNETDAKDETAELLRFNVTDDDFKEASKISMTDKPEPGNVDNEAFTITLDRIIDDNKVEFVITNKKPIDFETKQFYRLYYNLQSEDGRGDTSGSVEYQMMVFVQDVSDNPPYWVQPVPSLTLPECESGTEAFTVKAEDRDVTIGNDITYEITDGNVDDYFRIDSDTGIVTTAKDIDRETMDITTFALEIKATEVPQDSVNGEDSSIQVTNIIISDINDNSPEFNEPTFIYEMDELSDEGQDYILDDLDIFVVDMDELNNGAYTVTSSHPALEVIYPVPTGRLNSSVTLKAKALNGYFDYEDHEDNSLEITLTATEETNKTHMSTATLTITLRDINDNEPKFGDLSYTATVDETAQNGYLVTTVKATDDDITAAFGTPSIRYYVISKCPYLEINEETGEVTVSNAEDLDFEVLGNTVTCIVQAKDSYGNGTYKFSDVDLTITIIDMPDGVPVLTFTNEETEIPENQTDNIVLCNLIANDKDNSAKIIFTIDFDNSDPNDGIKEWFEIDDIERDESDFTSQVIAKAKKVDRDVLEKNQVSLTIVATDETSGNFDTKELKFNIKDINDCKPEFSDSETKFHIYENFKDKGCKDGDVITIIGYDDADEHTDITFNISTSDYVEVNKTGHLLVKNAKKIDRETLPNFTVDVIIDDGIFNNTKTLTVNVSDLNDNPPTFDQSICNQPYHVLENATDGENIITVITTDPDEGTNGLPRFRILYSFMDNPPFTIDENTGMITTKDNGRPLDREDKSFWNLYINAISQCGDSYCEDLLSDPDCMVNVTVLDVNDCKPDNFQIVKDGIVVSESGITVSESVKAGDELGYEIRAKDEDKPNTMNSNITYTVEDILDHYGKPFPNITFKATTLNRINTEDNYEYFCTLTSEGDLTHLRGSYKIIIKATDGAGEDELSNNYTIPLEVTDANDYPPEFVFPAECNSEVISMQENNNTWYWLKCSTNTDFSFTITDEDTDQKNKAVTVKILEDSSTSSDGALQLSAFEIVDVNTREYKIKITDEIDREKGQWYNLTIQAQDCVDCDPSQRLETIHYLKIIITNVFEFPPIFNGSINCNSYETKCEQEVYIPENEEEAEANFMVAYDEDNKSGDNDTQPVYYQIVDSRPYDGKLELKDKEKPIITADQLDRETTESYTIIIDTYNDEPYLPAQPYSAPQPNRLFLEVKVLDKYDNEPVFNNTNNITFGSFMPTDNIGKDILTIEALDKDLNETLIYNISGNFTWTGSEPPPNTDKPFKFEDQQEGSRISKLQLNFNPIGQGGYCTFPITVTDKGSMVAATEVKIFSITEKFQVPFYFENEISELQEVQPNLQASLTMIFELECKIDNIEPPGGKTTRDQSETMNIVMTHFINTTQNTVVETSIIERMAMGEKIYELQTQMESLNLNLRAIGDHDIKAPADYSQLYIILLAVAVGILLLALVLLGLAYQRSTTNLKRQVKAMTATTFGSVSSEINRIGLDSAPVPGSNQFSGEGANPMYNLEDFTIKEDDVSSVGSGDSVLVGVEDTEDFRNYGRGKGRAPQPPGKKPAPAAPYEEGFDNPAFTGRSIDQVSAASPPAAFDSTTRTNPLLMLGEEKDITDALSDYQFTVTRRTSSDMEDDDPGASALNSNFSFS